MGRYYLVITNFLLCSFAEGAKTQAHDGRLFQEVEIKSQKEPWRKKKGEKTDPFSLFFPNDESTDGIFTGAI